MMRNSVFIVLWGLAVVSPSVFAAEPQTTTAASNSSARTGEVSREWLQLQREGVEASPIQQRLPPAVQDRVYQRYLHAFEYPIPEHFYGRDRFVESQ